MGHLETALDTLYDRHLTLSANVNWGYHTLLPWERGKNFNDHPWAPDQGCIPPELTMAVETAMLTEVNLPWFTAGLSSTFNNAPKALQQFIRTWTQEEDQHGRVLDVYLILSRNGDPALRDQLRKQVIGRGWDPETDDPLALMVYTTLQELATRVFYLSLAKAATPFDPTLGGILRAIAKDESLHYAFYRDAVKTYLESNPSSMATICQVIPQFTMPGFGMPNFRHRAQVIARHAHYDLAAYYEQVLSVVLDYWGVLDYELSSDTREDRKTLDQYLTKLRRIAERKAVVRK